MARGALLLAALVFAVLWPRGKNFQHDPLIFFKASRRHKNAKSRKMAVADVHEKPRIFAAVLVCFYFLTLRKMCNIF